MEELKIVIGIKDGVPYIINNDKNIELVIYDYDVDGIHYEDLKRDQFGNKCLIDRLQ